MDRDMVRRLSIHEHGAAELLAGLALIAAPLVLGLGSGGLVAAAIAGTLIAGLGLAEGLPLGAHRAADRALAAAMAAAAVALGAAGEPVAGGLLAAAAAGELALGFGTRWTRR